MSRFEDRQPVALVAARSHTQTAYLRRQGIEYGTTLQSLEPKRSGLSFRSVSENRFTGKKVFPGETLFSSFQIASVASREDLQLRFWVHEADFLDLRLGRSVRVTADAKGSEAFLAEISWVSSQAEEKQDWSDGGYFEAYAMPVADVPEAIAPGMSVMGPAGKKS